MTSEKLIKLLEGATEATGNICATTLCDDCPGHNNGCTLYWVADELINSGVTIPVRCKDCDHGSHVDTPEGRVWCERLCRYMVYEGYCSYGERK